MAGELQPLPTLKERIARALRIIYAPDSEYMKALLAPNPIFSICIEPKPNTVEWAVRNA